MFEDKTMTPEPVEDRASTLAALVHAEPVAVEGTPEVVALEVTQLPKPPPPPKPMLPPYRQVNLERVHSSKGNRIGFDMVPLAGNALVKLELRDLFHDIGLMPENVQDLANRLTARADLSKGQDSNDLRMAAVLARRCLLGWKVHPFTETRRGRTPRSSKKKGN